MKLCIHRGTREIGGTCVELEADGARIVLDLGLPLDASDMGEVALPAVRGLSDSDESLLAIILSHGHRDHWGLLPRVRSDIPLVMGRAAESVMGAAADFIPGGFAPTASQYLSHHRALPIGPFVVTPHLVDHSGFDAYALVIEAHGRQLFYTGDLRAHGRKGKLFDHLLLAPPKDIDVMLMEGTTIGRVAQGKQPASESDLEGEFVRAFRETPGMALVACSAQNIDRVVTVYRAAKRTGRTLIIDAYAAEVLKATDRDSIPRPAPGWSNLAVFIPHAQRIQLKKKGLAHLVNDYRGLRIWPEDLAANAASAVMLFRGWMMTDLDRAGALAGARVIWSQWDGYLRDGAGARLRGDCQSRGIPFEIIHTSGHAALGDLQRLAAAIAPKQLIPIHTTERDQFPKLFANVLLVDDGQWVEV